MCGACAQPQCKPAAAIPVLVLHNGGFYKNICFALLCVCVRNRMHGKNKGGLRSSSLYIQGEDRNNRNP